MIDGDHSDVKKEYRDGYIRIAKFLIKQGAIVDIMKLKILGSRITFLEEAIEERERWMARRSLVLLLVGLTTAESTKATPCNSHAMTHR
jgi:hypothetical protein